ncbi:unnamed protein product [Brachionus calyciflorus]|uniref:Uncharacterized protein n=1 Tax=Brachionus calyciflorus TaxID=104777 RepID=A0A813UZI6_9BILA|nr:unnamed protein product [Brachionus calyciflorus]
MDEDSSSQFSTESEYERELVTQNFLEIETFFKSTQEYKFTQTHGGFDSKCDLCPLNLNRHKKNTKIKRCASNKLSNQEHLDVNLDPSDKQHGIHRFYLEEINRLYDEQKRPPTDILNILIHNKNRGLYDQRIKLPRLHQIKVIIYSSKSNENANEIGPS